MVATKSKTHAISLTPSCALNWQFLFWTGKNVTRRFVKRKEAIMGTAKLRKHMKWISIVNFNFLKKALKNSGLKF